MAAKRKLPSLRGVVSASFLMTRAAALTAGQLAKVRMECFNSSGNGLARLFWSSPSQALETIPQSQLIGPSTPPGPASAAVAPPNLPPLLTPIPDQTVGALSPLNFTPTATDLDLPPQTLTFSLDSGAPSGASINPVTGLFTWTPSLVQWPGTYGVTLRVTDNGNPPLSAASTFHVTVMVPAPVVTETDLSLTGGSFAPLAGNDLLLDNAGVSALSYFEAKGDWTPSNLTDGDLKAPGAVGNQIGVYSIITGGSVTYNLGGGANGTGYDITGVRSLAVWQDGGRINPKYTVSYSSDGANFTTLASVNYAAGSGANGTDVSLGIIGLSNVKYIKFDFSGGQQNGGVSYTELAAFGRPTPVATVSLSAQILSPGLTNLGLNISGLLPGQNYTLQSSPSLSPAAWSNEVSFAASQSTLTLTNSTSSSSQKFYRIVH